MENDTGRRKYPSKYGNKGAQLLDPLQTGTPPLLGLASEFVPTRKCPSIQRCVLDSSQSTSQFNGSLYLSTDGVL